MYNFISWLIYVIFIITVIRTNFLANDINYQYLINAQSLIGPTGNLVTPSPFITPKDNFTFGLHRFIIGVNYGIKSSMETGINLSLRQFSSLVADEIYESNSVIFHIKYNFLNQYRKKNILDFSLGSYSDTFYIVIGKKLFYLTNTSIQLGTDYSKNKLCYFVVFIQQMKYSFFICEYKSRMSEVNFGWRVLLAPDVKLDIFLRSKGNLKDWFSIFIFGLTIATNYTTG